MRRKLSMPVVFIVGLILLLTSCAVRGAVTQADWNDVLQHYRSLGEHRSGTDADRATALWLRSELQTRGLKTTVQEWPVRVFELAASYIESENDKLPAFPFWYPRSTGSKGIVGTLVNVSDKLDSEVSGSIALYRLPPDQYEFHFDIAPLTSEMAAHGAQAAIVVLNHPVKAVSAQNANKPHHQQTLPIPALIAAESDAARLLELASNQAAVRVMLDGTSRDGTARNVLGWLDHGEGSWIVISTPISGWFEVTNERGPGIALWLQLAQWAASEGIQANFLFTGLSGHELGKMGMDALVDSAQLPTPSDTCLWLHLGSGIAVQNPLLAAVSSASELEHSTRTTLVDQTNLSYWPEQKMPKGSEQYSALKLEYPVVGLFGADPTIHSRLDQAPRVDQEEYQRVLGGLQHLIRQRLAATDCTRGTMQ